MEPLVSVGIPTYNNSSMLKQAIMSVLQQTYQKFEIIVVDDCSTDNTAEIVSSFKEPRIQYFRTEKNLRPPRSWNVCARIAKGEFFALLPHDDVWMSDYLKHMTELLICYKDIGFVQCAFYQTDKELQAYGFKRVSEKTFVLKGECAVIWQMEHLLCNPASILFRTAAMKNMGLWREDYWDDWAFIVRTAYRFGFVYTPNLLANVRAHDTNLSRVLREEGRDGILDVLHQQSDVFGEVLPVSEKILALRSMLARSLSFSCLNQSIRSLLCGKFKKARKYFVKARHLNPLIPFDPGILRHCVSSLKRRCLKNISAGAKTAPILKIGNKFFC